MYKIYRVAVRDGEANERKRCCASILNDDDQTINESWAPSGHDALTFLLNHLGKVVTIMLVPTPHYDLLFWVLVEE